MKVKARGDYVNGRFIRKRKADATLQSFDPGDRDQIIGEFPTSSDAVDEAVAAARAAFAGWSRSDDGQRRAALRRLQAQLRNRREDIAQLLSAETGRPRWETRAEARLMQSEVDGLLHYGLAELSPRPTVPAGTDISFRALGVVVVLSPSVQPALLMHCDAIAAIASGCSVVCKGSPRTPAVAQLYAELMDEADFPRGVFNLVQGDDRCGARLAGDNAVQGVLCCGAEATKQSLERQLAQQPAKRLRTLTSGLPAALVLDDANLDQAAYQIAIGACISSGQRCTNTKRILVDERVADALIERLVPLLAALKVGHSSDETCFMGPLIGGEANNRYFGDVAQLLDQGGKALLQGDASAGKGAFVTPTLLEIEAGKLAEVCQRELTGPVLVLARARSLEEGVALVNTSPYGLAVSLFTRSDEQRERVEATHRCGLLAINAPTTSWPGRLPLHPWGRASNDQPWGAFTTRFCTRVTVAIREQPSIDPTMLPPGVPGELERR